MNTQKEILSKEKLDAKVEILGHQLTDKCHEYGGATCTWHLRELAYGVTVVEL